MGLPQSQTQSHWMQKHSEAYLLVHVDSPLLVQIGRPADGEER